MGKVILITGTDTGVGKTYVGSLILKATLKSKINAFAIKPIETGCQLLKNGTIIPNDALIYQQILSSNDIEISQICLYMFHAPLSPNIASRLSGNLPDIEELKRRISLLSNEFELLLVEGAGGLMVEIIDGYHFGDLARELDMELLLVAPDKLGVINHVSLNLEYIKRSQLHLRAIILNEILNKPDPSKLYNEAELKRRFDKIQILKINYNESDPSVILKVLNTPY